MADFILFQDHHVIEQQALKDSPLLQKLTQMNLFNIEDAGNHFNMPASKILTAVMNVSPHNGGPLGEYSNRLDAILSGLETSPLGEAGYGGGPIGCD